MYAADGEVYTSVWCSRHLRYDDCYFQQSQVMMKCPNCSALFTIPENLADHSDRVHRGEDQKKGRV